MVRPPEVEPGFSERRDASRLGKEASGSPESRGGIANSAPMRVWTIVLVAFVILFVAVIATGAHRHAGEPAPSASNRQQLPMSFDGVWPMVPAFLKVQPADVTVLGTVPGPNLVSIPAFATAYAANTRVLAAVPHDAAPTRIVALRRCTELSADLKSGAVANAGTAFTFESASELRTSEGRRIGHASVCWSRSVRCVLLRRTPRSARTIATIAKMACTSA